MNRTTTILKLALAAAFALVAVGATGCYGEIDGGPADYPSSAYIATASPVYYEGRPAYWYGDHWYYRGGGGRWGYYRSEPRYLYQARGHYRGGYAAPSRRYEGRGRRR